MKKLLPIFFALSLPAFAELRLEKSDASMKVLDGDKLITEYRTDWKVPYLYPLIASDGAQISRHWPTDPNVEGEEHDHPHHRSIWFGHGLVNGADFWSFKDSFDEKITHKGFENITKNSFTADLDWTTGDKKLLTEKRTYAFKQIDKETLEIDFTFALTALDDILFGDTKEGMFGLRLDRTLRLKGPLAKSHIVNSNGMADQNTWGKRSNWVAYTGPDELGEQVVVSMFDHPTSFRYPTYWHVRDYGLIAANPFGVHEFEGKKDDKNLGDYTLKKGGNITFRYAIIIHHGDIKTVDLNKLWESFSKN